MELKRCKCGGKLKYDCLGNEIELENEEWLECSWCGEIYTLDGEVVPEVESRH